MSADSDQARPLEVVTKGQYSHRQMDRELSYFVAVGTLVLIHDPQMKGSQLTPKSSWWVVQEMYREQLVLWAPFSHAVRKSKSDTAFKFTRGLSYNKFLSLNEAPPPKRQTEIPTDFDEKLIVKMQRLFKALKVKNQQSSYGAIPLVTVHNAVKDFNSGDGGGSVTVFDELGCQLSLNKANRQLCNPAGELSHEWVPKVNHSNNADGELSVDCNDNDNPAIIKMWDKVDAKAVGHFAVVSK